MNVTEYYPRRQVLLPMMQKRTRTNHKIEKDSTIYNNDHNTTTTEHNQIIYLALFGFLVTIDVAVAPAFLISFFLLFSINASTFDFSVVAFLAFLFLLLSTLASSFPPFLFSSAAAADINS